MAIVIEGTPSLANLAAATYTAETTGTNRLLVIIVSGEDSATPDLTACTFGGVAATVAMTDRSGGATGPYQNASICYLKQAQLDTIPGPQSATATFDSGALTVGPYFDFYTLSGVDQTTVVDDTSSDTLSNVAGTTYATGISLETNTTGGLSFVVSVLAASTASHSAWGSFTEVADAVMGTNAYRRAIATVANTGATVTANPTFSASQSFAAMVAAAFKPAGGGGGSSIAPLAHYYYSMRRSA